ncbi:MAG TPA: carboxypeptidase-like regulatory domain-containing protein, partial [Gemmatimonadaceae bacterium]|nr:carboxypeptidase-like regulatory domain-containing protein [Gemmatimonadaceae bacterium]
MLLRLAVLCTLLALTRASIAAQGQTIRHEIVRGRVIADSARPLAHANVIVTRTRDRQFRSATTDTDGMFSIDWPDGTGDYVVHVDAVGFTSVNRALRRSRTDSVLVADVRLSRAGGPQALAPVVTNAERPRPTRDPGADVAASEYTTVPQNAARRLAPDLAGDLAAIAALAPGVLPVNGGISVFGLGTAQNST